MAVIKKFRIKSFKNLEPIVEFENENINAKTGFFAK